MSYGGVHRNPSQNSFSTWSDFGAFADNEDEDIPRPEDIPLSILKYGIKNDINFKAFTAETVLPRTKTRHPINGVWTGHLYRLVDDQFVSSQGLIQIAVALTNQYRIEGGGESYSGLLSLSGEARPERKPTLEVVFRLTYPDGFTTKASEDNPLAPNFLT